MMFTHDYCAPNSVGTNRCAVRDQPCETADVILEREDDFQKRSSLSLLGQKQTYRTRYPSGERERTALAGKEVMTARRQAPTIVAALPDLFTAGLFLASWNFPTWFGTVWIHNLTTALVVEFALVSALTISLSAAWNGEGPTTPERRRNLGLGLLLLFPVIFLLVPWQNNLGFSAGAFAWLLFTRMFDIWWHSGRGEVESKRLVLQVGFGFVIFLPLLVVAGQSHVPPLGFTPEFVRTLHPDQGPGNWYALPERISFFGVIYYTIQAALKFWMAWLAMHVSATRLPGPPIEKPKLSPAEDTEGSRAAAENLAKSGYTREEISCELQRWRGLSAAEADKIADNIRPPAL